MRWLVSLVLVLGLLVVPVDAARRCLGSDPCRACKTCRYCAHCAGAGGSCGVCR